MCQRLSRIEIQEIATKNIALVRKIANQNRGFCEVYHVDIDEIVSIGTIGLMKAIERYNPAKKSFSSFACLYIRGEILHYFRDGKFNLIRNKRGEKKTIVFSLDASLRDDSNSSFLDVLNLETSGIDENYSSDIDFMRQCLQHLSQNYWDRADAIQMSINGLNNAQIAKWLEISKKEVIELIDNGLVDLKNIASGTEIRKPIESKSYNVLPCIENGVLKIPKYKGICKICNKFFGRWNIPERGTINCCSTICISVFSNSKRELLGKRWSDDEYKLLDSLVGSAPPIQVIKSFQSEYPQRSHNSIKNKLNRRYKTTKAITNN